MSLTHSLAHSYGGSLSLHASTYEAPGGSRTHDLRFRKPSLYPLSYKGVLPTTSF